MQTPPKRESRKDKEMEANRIFELAKTGLQAEINGLSKLDIECIEITGQHDVFYHSQLQRLIAERERLELIAKRYENKDL